MNLVDVALALCHSNGMKEKYVQVPKAVIKVLRECSAFGGVLKLPDRDLGKKLYGEVKRVLETTDGKWSTSKQAFLFTHDGLDQIAAIIRTGKAFHRKQTFQEFLTPTGLAAKLAELITEAWRFKEIGSDEFWVLEPSAGKGSLVNALLSRYDFMQDIRVTVCEIQKDNLRHIPDDPRVIKVCMDFLRGLWLPPESSGADGYHAILMNPPFNGKTWAKHVNHALKFRAKGGVLVAIVPRMHTLVDLDLPSVADAFLTPIQAKFAGTGVKVSILTIGIKKDVVDAVLESVIDKTDCEEPEEELKSPEYYLREVQRLNKEVEKTLNELEREIRKCLRR